MRDGIAAVDLPLRQGQKGPIGRKGRSYARQSVDAEAWSQSPWSSGSACFHRPATVATSNKLGSRARKGEVIINGVYGRFTGSRSKPV
jgi:hypothetical protein